MAGLVSSHSPYPQLILKSIYTLNKSVALKFLLLFNGWFLAGGQETLPIIRDGRIPQSYNSLWADFDPRAEPLETEILKEWEEDGVVMQVLRYRIGIFKGRKAMMAAVYGYPKGGEKLPGLVQIHGGGQYADYRAVLTNGKRGYATISIAWAGRINAPDYKVNPEIVKLFWEGKTEDSSYKLTTDWGPLDAYHAPSRFEKNPFPTIISEPWSLDAVPSPRNNGWFLCTLAARRALTFLERQPEVDATKLGVYGHSMGGKLTVMTAGADKRVKAAAPSCGGISNRYSDDPLYSATLGDDVYLKHIACPIIFLSPSNDFHGTIRDLQTALGEIKTDEWRITSSAHHNHQDLPQYEVATQLWFDQHLKGTFVLPKTPDTNLDLKRRNGVPLFSVKPDTSKPVLSVEVYFTQQGQEGEEHRDNRINRFWHYAKTKKIGQTWTAELPLYSTDKPVWVYTNVLYPLEDPVTGAGYYYGIYEAKQFNLSSRMHMASPEQLKANKVRPTLKGSPLIESFEGDWEKEWFTYKPEEWSRRTHKIYDDPWKAPAGAQLVFEVRSEQPNILVVGIDDSGVEVPLTGGVAWQRVDLSATDLWDASGNSLSDWTGIKELRFGSREVFKIRINGEMVSKELGGDWTGEKPEFRNLRWGMPHSIDK